MQHFSSVGTREPKQGRGKNTARTGWIVLLGRAPALSVTFQKKAWLCFLGVHPRDCIRRFDQGHRAGWFSPPSAWGGKLRQGGAGWPAAAAVLAQPHAAALALGSHMRSHVLPFGNMRLRACLTVLALLASSLAQQVVQTETICGYDSKVIQFDSTVGGVDVTVNGINMQVEMERLGVFSIETGKPSLDIGEIMCLRGLCPVFLKGKNLDMLVGTDFDEKALMEEQGILPQNRAFCFFGVDLPCSPVPNTITSESLMCSPPTLPKTYGIAPFGIFVLKPTLEGPGTLYLAEGLELNFYDSKQPPEPLRLAPPYSDFRDVPETVRVIGLNFGENSYGIYCMWVLGGEEQEPVAGEFDAKEQLAGDDENEVICPGPARRRLEHAGEIGYLRLSMTGPGEAWGGAGAAGTFSGAPPGAPPGTPAGAPLTFFDQGRKPLLYGHDLRPEVQPYPLTLALALALALALTLTRWSCASCQPPPPSRTRRAPAAHP